MNVFAREFDEALVLKPCGRLYSRTAPLLLEEAFQHTQNTSKPVIIDMESLYSINAAGYRILHVLANKLGEEKRAILLSNCRLEFQDRLQSAGLCKQASFPTSLDEALASLRH